MWHVDCTLLVAFCTTKHGSGAHVWGLHAMTRAGACEAAVHKCTAVVQRRLVLHYSSTTAAADEHLFPELTTLRPPYLA